MKNKAKKILSSVLLAAMTLSVVEPTIVNAMPQVESNQEVSGYEIYPKPHDLEYTGDEFVIRKDVNVVYDSTIDDVTKNRLNEVLSLKDKNITSSESVVSGKTNVLVGTYSSNGYVDNYVQEKYDLDPSLFEKNDSYYLASKDGEIVILGKNTDAAFYGITTLKHIFNQMDGSTIKNVVINDYSDAPIRGFIEGYYGIPWTNKDRMSLMEFGGEFKMTSYIFAPKDDVYHTSKWREVYPSDELEKIKEMVQVGINTKTKFVWTAHPFMGGFNANDFEGEMDKLIKKFEQLYSVGVRQFGILGDDVGSLDKQIVVNMMKRLSEWGNSKGDVYDWVFCPAGYNASWQGDYSELNTYDADFPENVQIFWTGQSVCAPVSQETLTNFRTHRASEGTKRRSPLFWLNWPVNDINMSRLMMGKGSLLHTDINTEDLAGVVTNPMQDAEPSKVSLFAIADYTWNVNGFDDDKSWEDSFKYIDADASEALYTIAKHTSDPAPNGHGLVLDESEEIKPLLDSFMNKLNAKESISEIGRQLVNEMDKIIEACDKFVKTSKNERMVEQITPFSNSLKDLALSIRSFIQTAIDLEGNDNDSAIQNFAEGTTEYANSKKYDRPMLNGTKKAQPGSKRLVPFAEGVRDALSDEINSLVNGGGEKLVLTATSNINNIYQGSFDNIVDGKDDTFVWNGVYESQGQYYQVNLSKPTTIYGVDILNGTTGKKDDTFGTAKVQYTTNGTDWNDINNKTYGPYVENVKVTGVEIKNVTGLRYICTEKGAGNKWPAMREFKVLTTPQVEEPTFTSEVIRTTNGWSVHSGKESDMLDGDESTGVHYNVRQQGEPVNTTIAGDYVGVKLSEPIVLGKINILQGPNSGSGDYFKNATLEYSLDGVDYETIDVFENTRDIIVDLSDRNIEAQYVRLRNNVNQGTWIGFREFNVNSKVYHNGKVYTNVDSYKEHPADYFEDNASMVELSDITLRANQYIGLMLDRIHELNSLILNGTGLENIEVQVSKNAYEWTNLEDKSLNKNIDARYIRLVNLSDADVTFDVSEFKVRSKEFTKSTLIETNMGTIAEGKIENLFDKDRSTGLKYQKTQAVGDYMILDLGQEIDLNELKIVVHDSDKDYIRDGKVYVSADKSNWGEAIIEMGDQSADTTNDDSTINNSFPYHEISYNVAKAENINERARYIKIEITQPYGHRWTKINEIEVNRGEYIPSVNNPTFESNVLDTQNGLYEYLVDGDITTMFIPSSDTGYLVYSLSENNEVNYIKVMQNAKVISNAKVLARVLTDNKNDEWIELGTLNKGTNEFVLPAGTTILDVKFEWNGVIANLVELSFDSKLDTNVNKGKLQELVDETIDTTTWTTDSVKNYNDAIAVAKELIANNYVAQETIDSAVKEIEKAKSNKELKCNSDEVQSVIDSAITYSVKYTSKTWANYQGALNALKSAMEDKDNLSVAEANRLIDKLNNAKEDLVYNPTNREEAEIVLEDMNVFIGKITEPAKTYTINSWNALMNAKDELEALIEANKTEAKDPALFNEAKETLLNSKESLVNITLLISEIKAFEAVDKNIYTEESYNSYADEIEKSKELLVSGNNENIEDSIAKISKAKNSLELVGSSENIKTLVENIKKLTADNYTTNSYEKLMNKVVEVEKMDFNNMTSDELKNVETELLTLKNSLVDVTALRSAIEIANSFEAEKYTIDSYNALTTLVKSAEEALVNGNTESVQELVNKIDVATKNLTIRVNSSELIEYINSIEKVDLDKYTEETAFKYEEALAVLKAMVENSENVSATEFINAKNIFEEAKAALELIKEEKPDTDDNTENDGIGSDMDTDKDDSEDSKNETIDGPQTGDNRPITILLVISLLAVSGIALTLNKKKAVK